MTATVGVIGGMGPAATWDFCRKLLAATPAARDQDHLRVVVDCDPTVLDRNAALAGAGPSPGPRLVEMAAGLERQGADLLVIACNTAHAWAPDIRASVSIPLIDMVGETAAELPRRHLGVRAAGVLAADGCLAAGLYQRALDVEGLAPVLLTPASQARFMEAVYAVKAGDTGPAVRATMAAMAGELVASGAEAVVSACTEVPLVLRAADVSVPLLDSTDVAVATILRRLGRAPA